MASYAQNTGGYDCKFVEDPPDALKCLICLSVARDPQQHGDCGKLFCNSCITEYRKRSNDCPHCRKNLVTFNDGKSAQEVKSLRVKCDNLDYGCQWVGELRSLDDHLTTCGYTLLPCTNECKKENKTYELLRKNLTKHLMVECPRRQHECEYCGEVGEYEERTSSHLDICPQFKISCPNKCGEMIPRCQNKQHRSTCLYEMVSCKYKTIGCKTIQRRRDMQKHEEDNQLHLDMAMNTVLELSTAMTELKSKQISTSNVQKPSGFVFKVTRFQERKQTRLYSDPFYTHSGGYKMCAIIDPNGYDKYEGTHVSVFACLMKGVNDDSLTWPFSGSIKFELLNQLEDKNHQTYNIGPFPAGDDEVSGRVVNGERGAGWGKRDFIPHTELGYNQAKNCQYLKDDTLVFRISCEIPNSNLKPWLDCTAQAH